MALTALSLSIACAGAGCGGDDSTSPPTPDAGDDGGSDARAESSTGDAAPDAADSAADAPADSAPDADAGAPHAVFATTPLDLGAGNCGGTAVQATLSIQNTGTRPLTVMDSVTGTVFSVSPASLTVAPGASGTLTISATVPQASTAGSALSGALSLTTNDPSHATATINLSVTPTGATLAWDTGSPSAAAFGTQRVGQAAAPIALTLKNSGNASAVVAFAAPGGMFSLSPTTATVAAGATGALSAGFTPTNTTAQTATSTFTVTGAVCGTSVSTLAFSGQGGTGNVNGWPTAAIDFGQNACGGAAPAAKTFTLTNTGSVAAHITAITFSGYAGYTTDATVGSTIAANGGTLVVSVSAPSVPFPSAIPGNYAATVTYATDVTGDSPHQVNVTESAKGAIIAFDTSGTPGFGNFGQVPVGTTASQNFAIVNSGNVSSSVTVSDTTPFSVATATFNLAGGASQADVARFAPAVFGNFTSQLGVTATNLCQPVPAAIPLSGTGEAGGISITNPPTPFTVNCGATATAQQMTITNAGNQPMTWSAVLNSTNSVSGTWYDISPAGATLAAGASSTLTVTPKAMPQYPTNPTNTAQFNDRIVVTTDIPGDTPHNVALSETPLGAIIGLDTSGFSFSATPINTPETSSFIVTNSANAGSAQATVGIASTGPDASHFVPAPTSAAVGPGGSSTVSVTFQAATAGTYQADLAFASSDVLCAPLPADVTRSAQATQAGPACNSVGGGPCALVFGNVNCGARAGAAQLFMTNTGTQPYTVTAATLTNGTYFTVAMSPANGVVTPGGTVTITVTPRPIPGTVPSVPDTGTYSDQLTITTNANVQQPNFTAPLTMGAAGVIVSNPLSSSTWNFGTVPSHSTGFFNVFIRNVGNQQLTVALTGVQQPTIFGLQNNPVTDTAPPDLLTITGTFTPPAPQGYSDSGTLTVTPVPGAVFCQPLPPSWVNPTITFQGNGSTAPGITISPNTLPFPAALCGGTNPAAENVNVTNNLSTPQSYTAALANGTYYAITSGASGTIAGGGSAVVAVQPIVNLAQGGGASIGSAPYNDVLIITVSGTQYQIPVTMSVNGVVLTAVNPYNYSFNGYRVDGSNGSFSVQYYDENYYSNHYSYLPQIQNTGNITGTVTANLSSPGSGWTSMYFSSTPSSASIPAAQSQSYQVYVTSSPYHGSWIQGIVQFSSPNMCNAPLAVSVAGYFYP